MKKKSRALDFKKGDPVVELGKEMGRILSFLKVSGVEAPSVVVCYEATVLNQVVIQRLGKVFSLTSVLEKSLPLF